MQQARLSPRTWGLMALLALIWGGSFTANHAALSALPVTTTVASLMVTVTVTTSPAFSVLFTAPVAVLMATALTVGAVVSTT